MNSKNLIIITLLLCASVITGCSAVSNTDERANNSNDNEQEKKASGGKVLTEDSIFDINLGQKATFGESKKEANQTAKDGSEISTMHDGYGNTVQTRYFYNHPNLKILTVKTLASGEKEGIAFGHNGERKKLSPEASAQGLTASGNEITNLVGITTTKIQPAAQPVIVNNTQPANYPKIQPVSPNPPIQTETQPTESVKSTEPQAETAKPQVETVKPNPPTVSDKPQLTQNRKPQNIDNQ